MYAKIEEYRELRDFNFAYTQVWLETIITDDDLYRKTYYLPETSRGLKSSVFLRLIAERQRNDKGNRESASSGVSVIKLPARVARLDAIRARHQAIHLLRHVDRERNTRTHRFFETSPTQISGRDWWFSRILHNMSDARDNRDGSIGRRFTLCQFSGHFPSHHSFVNLSQKILELKWI